MNQQSVALVTGGNRGIGREICRQLGDRGYHVLLACRDAAGGVAAARELALEFTPLDLHVQASIDRLAESLERRKLALDVLVHNAGVRHTHFDLDVVRDTLAVNFDGPNQLTTALLPHLRPHARVVILSSVLGDLSVLGPQLRPRFTDPTLDRLGLAALMHEYVAHVAAGDHEAAGWPANPYAVSKIGATMLAQVLARELADDPRQLRFNAMCPGWVKTAMGGEGAQREIPEGADTAVWLATQGPDGPNSGFFHDRAPLPG